MFVSMVFASSRNNLKHSICFSDFMFFKIIQNIYFNNCILQINYKTFYLSQWFFCFRIILRYFRYFNNFVSSKLILKYFICFSDFISFRRSLWHLVFFNGFVCSRTTLRHYIVSMILFLPEWFRDIFWAIFWDIFCFSGLIFSRIILIV